MAQDPELDVDPSSDLDMVTVFSSSNHDAEMEATNVQSMLQSNGIDAMLQGPHMIPSLEEFQVLVPRNQADEATRLIAEARAAGPSAAAEAEAASEHQ